jgi:hypothetical protein
VLQLFQNDSSAFPKLESQKLQFFLIPFAPWPQYHDREDPEEYFSSESESVFCNLLPRYPVKHERRRKRKKNKKKMRRQTFKTFSLSPMPSKEEEAFFFFTPSTITLPSTEITGATGFRLAAPTS